MFVEEKSHIRTCQLPSLMRIYLQEYQTKSLNSNVIQFSLKIFIGRAKIIVKIHVKFRHTNEILRPRRELKHWRGTSAAYLAGRTRRGWYVHARRRNKPISRVHSAGHRTTKAAFMRANRGEDARSPRAGRFPRIILAI